jgi:hypothetical protein
MICSRSNESALLTLERFRPAAQEDTMHEREEEYRDRILLGPPRRVAVHRECVRVSRCALPFEPSSWDWRCVISFCEIAQCRLHSTKKERAINNVNGSSLVHLHSQGPDQVAYLTAAALACNEYYGHNDEHQSARGAYTTQDVRRHTHGKVDRLHVDKCICAHLR